LNVPVMKNRSPRRGRMYFTYYKGILPNLC
jgi:hypothetical protein